MKKENYKAADLIEKIDEYCYQMPSLPEFKYKRKQGTFNVGDLKEGLYQDFYKNMHD